MQYDTTAIKFLESGMFIHPKYNYLNVGTFTYKKICMKTQNKNGKHLYVFRESLLNTNIKNYNTVYKFKYLMFPLFLICE